MYEKPHLSVLISGVYLLAMKPLYKQYKRPSSSEILRKRPKTLAISLIFLLLCWPEKVPLTWSESYNYTININSLAVNFGSRYDFRQRRD